MMQPNPIFPTGTVTFLFTDIEDSSRLWEQHPQAMKAVLARHDQLMQAAVASHNGVLVKTTGDGIHAVFGTADDAARAAVASLQAIAGETWPEIQPDVLRVRAGLHTGQAELRDGDYYGSVVNRAARVMSIGHGGQILLSEATARLLDAQLPPDYSLTEIEEVNLRGLNRPERIHQLSVPGLPNDFPPLRADRMRRDNLPASVTSFIGRQRELEEVVALLQSTRLLTLTGPGGTGKTRLSLEVGAKVLDDYPHGVWLAELAPLTDPASVRTAVAGLWGLRENPMMLLEQMMGDYLRSKKLLLILDNCEHLVQACAELASDLLAAAPDLTILASSREGLGTPGETTYHLATLTVPGNDRTTRAELEGFEGVQLFVERAQAAQPAFALTDDNAAAVGRIVRRLDGIPLAIELAAARIKLLPPAQLAERLDDRFRLLTGGSRTALPRQQTLRALIDWSYDYLDEAEQAMFRQLGVFSGGWSLEAAEVVVDLSGLDGDIFDLMANLVNKSLVVVDDNEGEARFHFLETIRQYARDRLFESGEGAAARERHLGYFAKLVLALGEFGRTRAVPDLFAATGSHKAIAWVQQLKPEIDNVRSAIEWALEVDPETALDMALRLPQYFLFEGSMESIQWLSYAHDAVIGLPMPTGEAAELRTERLVGSKIWLGNLELAQGRHPAAVETLQWAIETARAHRLEAPLAMALSLQSLPLFFLSDPKAYEIAREADALLEAQGDARARGMSLSVMARIAMQQGDVEAARAHLAEATELSGSVMSFTQALSVLGSAHLWAEFGDRAKGEALLIQAKDTFDRIGSRHFGAMAESELGHLKRGAGNDRVAEEIYFRTLAIWHDLGHRAAMAHELEVLAFITSHRGDVVRASTLLGAAERIRQEAGIEMLPKEREEYLREVAALHEAASETFDDAWKRGSQMDNDEVLTFALSEDGAHV